MIALAESMLVVAFSDGELYKNPLTWFLVRPTILADNKISEKCATGG